MYLTHRLLLELGASSWQIGIPYVDKLPVYVAAECASIDIVCRLVVHMASEAGLLAIAEASQILETVMGNPSSPSASDLCQLLSVLAGHLDVDDPVLVSFGGLDGPHIMRMAAKTGCTEAARAIGERSAKRQCLQVSAQRPPILKHCVSWESSLAF